MGSVVQLRAACGRQLRADQLLPSTAAAGALPLTFVWAHGLASVRQSQKSDALMALAQRNGAGCLRLDLTGHGESDGGRDDVTLTAWLDDLECAVQAVPEITPEAGSGGREPQVVLVGYSLGGLAAAHFATRCRPGQLSALVLLAPGLGLAQRLQSLAPAADAGAQQMPSAWVAAGVIEVSTALRDDLLRNHPSDAEIAQGLRGLPTLIVHGEADDTVPVGLASEFYELLSLESGSAAAGPVELLRITDAEGGDHRLNRCIPRIFGDGAEMESFLRRQGLLLPGSPGE